MKKILKISLLFIIISGMFTLISCGKSLDKILLEGNGSWQCEFSNDKHYSFTFFENGKVNAIENGKKHENGNYSVEDNVINFVNDDGKINSSLKNLTIEKNIIKGIFTKQNTDESINITMTKIN